MNLCIPVDDDRGLESSVCPHFGSAPAFMIVDTESGSCRLIANHNQHHGHGMCAPLATLEGEAIDGMAVGGIGRGALSKLAAANIRVFLSDQATVAETVAACKDGRLKAMGLEMACSHGHGHS